METNIPALRKAIKAKYPGLQFKVRTISFSGFGYGSKVFVESEEWGMVKGNQETFAGVKAIAEQFGAIASW